MLRLTGQAPVTSLLRYGYVVTGSGMSDAQVRQINTRLLNVLARRNVGVGPSARLRGLFAMAGILDSYNLYIQQCSETLNLILRATDGSIQNKMNENLQALYGVTTWRPQSCLMGQSDDHYPLIGRPRYLDYDVAESWIFQTLTDRIGLPRRDFGSDRSSTPTQGRSGPNQTCNHSHTLSMKRGPGRTQRRRSSRPQAGGPTAP